MKTLATQHALMEKRVALTVERHKMTKSLRKEFERLTGRALKRSMQIETRGH